MLGRLSMTLHYVQVSIIHGIHPNLGWILILPSDNASLRAYLVQYSLADSVDGSERRLLKVSSRPTTVSLELCQPTASSSRHGSNATEGKRKFLQSDQ